MPIMKPPFGTQLIKGHPLADGLVGAWVMNEGMGGTIYDASGLGNHGTLTSMDPNTDWVAGQDGWALDFDGSDDSVITGNINLGAGPRTYFVVVNFDVVQTGYSSNWVSTGGEGTPGGELSLGESSGLIYSTAWDGSYDGPIIASPTLSVGQRYGVCLTYESSVHKFYLDGSYLSASDKNRAINTGNTPIRFGSRLTYSKYDGKMSLGIVWTRALSASEIASLYADPYQMFDVSPNIRKYWYLPTGGHPAGATHYLPIIARHKLVAAQMPDSGNTFAADLVIDEAFADWSSVVPLTVDADRVGSGGVTDFPMLITEAGFPDHYWSNVATDGKDIRIASASGTTLSHELVSIDTTAKTQQIWVKVPALSSSTDTTLFVHYGNPDATMPTATEQQATWSGYVAVLHMGEASGNLVDSTANANHATTTNALTYGQTGKVGKAVQFDGSTSYAEIPTSSSMRPNNLSLSSWFRLTDNTKSLRSVLSVAYNGPPWSSPYVSWLLRINGDTQIETDVGNGVAYSAKAINISSLGTTNWHHLCIDYDGTTLTAVLDGVSVGTSNVVSGNIGYGSKPCVIGADQGTNPHGGFLPGLIDEMRVGATAKSVPWRLTEYNNQSSPATFYSVGSVTTSTSTNWEGGAADFIDGLEADGSDLRVYDADGTVEIPYGIKQLSQTEGSRRLVLGLGIKSTAPLSATSNTTYRLYRGCTGGPFENRSAVVPLDDGFVGYWPMEESSGNILDWTASNDDATRTGCTADAGVIGDGQNFLSGQKAVTSGNISSSQYTLLTWAEFDGGGAGSYILANIEQPWPPAKILAWRYVSYVSPKVVGITVDDGSISGTIPTTTGQHLLAVTRATDGSGVMYLDGKVDNTGTLGALGCIVGMCMGNTVVATSPLNGVLDELSVHNVVRSASWIQTYYNMTSNNESFWTVDPEVTLAFPPGATHYIPVIADHTKLAASMPDSGSTFAADLVIDEALAINWEGGVATFISGLSADCSDLRVFSANGAVEIPFGVKQFSQTVGSRKLILGLGIKSTAPLSSTTDTTYRLYRGCVGGTFENRSGVVPTADGWYGYWPLCDASGELQDWTSGNGGTQTGGVTYGAAGVMGYGLSFDGVNDRITTGVISHGIGTGSFAMGGYIKTSSHAAWQTICSNGDYAPALYACGANEAADKLNSYWSGMVINGPYVNDGTFHHCVMQRSGTTVYHVVDGSQYGTTATRNTSMSNAQFCIGVETIVPDPYYFAGVMSDVFLSTYRSNDWWLSYSRCASDNDSFWSIGPERPTQLVIGTSYSSTASELRIAAADGIIVRGFR